MSDSNKLLDALLSLTIQIAEQTEAINNLADSNHALIQAMIDSGDTEAEEATHYMDGSPIG